MRLTRQELTSAKRVLNLEFIYKLMSEVDHLSDELIVVKSILKSLHQTIISNPNIKHDDLVQIFDNLPDNLKEQILK